MHVLHGKLHAIHLLLSKLKYPYEHEVTHVEFYNNFDLSLHDIHCFYDPTP